MLERWVAPLRGRVSGARALEAVRCISGHHRIQASPGYDAAAEWLVGELGRAGLEPEVVRVPGDGRTAFRGCVMPEGWACERAVAMLRSGARLEPLADFVAEPLSLIQRSAPVEGRFPLAWVSGGDQVRDYDVVDVRGRVVLTEGAVQRVHQLAVIERGAAGVLSFGRRLLPPVRTREDDRDSLAYTSFWWAGDAPRGWGFVVTPARGEALRERLARGEALELEARIESRRYVTEIPLVTAVLPGSSNAEVLLTSHLCHPRPGANDNASGAAATLEAMLALAGSPTHGAPRRRGIRALWMPEFTGTYAWLAARPAAAQSTLAALNLDMVGEDQGACGSVQRLERAPHFIASFADELARHVRHATLPQDPVPPPRTAEGAFTGGSDHAVWIDPTVGVPCPILIQWPDRFYHSSYDTPERCSPRSLEHAALTAAVYATWLAEAGPGEAGWLGAEIARSARREMRAALDRPEPGGALREARLRAQQALASLERFAIGGEPAEWREALASTIAEHAEAIEGVRDSEIPPGLDRRPTAIPAPRTGAVPVRRSQPALVPMRSLQDGWRELGTETRERWLEWEAMRQAPGVALELAWLACDGVRTVGEIAGLLADEGSSLEVQALAEYFDWLVTLGACRWRD
ncbi:MAG TPA: DUF4910 domain-containing protein [Candidatus Acidoferrales bacterium]|nr:DUF4910 domain-containing protein [Candidatus Acidoferrales bacterium]